MLAASSTADRSGLNRSRLKHLFEAQWWPDRSANVFVIKILLIYIYIFFFCPGDFVLKWSELSYVDVLEYKSTMHIRVTLYWGYLIVLWLFYVVCILYCGCFNLSCNVWVWLCVGVLVICIIVFTVFCIVLFMYIYSCLLLVRITATEWKTLGVVAFAIYVNLILWIWLV
jgi:hypothetical protein